MPPSQHPHPQPQSSPPLSINRKRSSSSSSSDSHREDTSCVSIEINFFGNGIHRHSKKPRTTESSGSEKQLISLSVSSSVSTSLTLFNESLPLIPVSIRRKESSPHDFSSKLAAMKKYTREEEKEESEKGVSTKLTLYTDPWKIRKNLTRSDLGDLCRLLVKTSLIKHHVLPYLSQELVAQVESKEGAVVMVFDKDTMSEHELVLKKWVSSKSYIFMGKWGKDFARRRELREGDEIGLYWDPNNARFNFCLLNRNQHQIV